MLEDMDHSVFQLINRDNSKETSIILDVSFELLLLFLCPFQINFFFILVIKYYQNLCPYI